MHAHRLLAVHAEAQQAKKAKRAKKAKAGGGGGGGWRYDFVLQTRHDLAVTTPIDQWPAEFPRLLFEQQCWKCCAGTFCQGGCACGRDHRFIREHVRPSVDGSSSCVPEGCVADMCVADRMVWMPWRYFGLVTQTLEVFRSNGITIHQLILAVVDMGLRQGLLTPLDLARGEVGFLFPPTAVDGEYDSLHMRRDALRVAIEKAREGAL